MDKEWIRYYNKQKILAICIGLSVLLLVMVPLLLAQTTTDAYYYEPWDTLLQTPQDSIIEVRGSDGAVYIVHDSIKAFTVPTDWIVYYFMTLQDSKVDTLKLSLSQLKFVERSTNTNMSAEELVPKRYVKYSIRRVRKGERPK